MAESTTPTLTRRILLGAALSLGLAGAAAAQFPERAVTLVIPFAAGGSTDVVGRIVAERMSQELGQQVIVQNVGGAGGSLGAQQVAEADPDGHTILMGTQELIDLAKAEPLAYASSGNGTPLHLSGELFKAMTGVDITHIPYKGSGPALTDVLGNQVPIIFDNLPSAFGHISSGKLKALGVTTAERAPSFPDVPAIAETLPGYETYSWNALFAPAGTPADAIAALNAAATTAMADPAVVARMGEFSATIVASTPEELAQHVTAEMAKWEPVVRDANVTMD